MPAGAPLQGDMSCGRRTGLGRLLTGSVAEQVVRRATCPVLTVKTPVPETVPAAEVRADEVRADEVRAEPARA